MAQHLSPIEATPKFSGLAFFISPLGAPKFYGTSAKNFAHVPAILLVKETDGVKTMSSLDMVAYINATRKPGDAELRHNNFLAKVPTVLGYSDSAKFLAQYKDSTGRSLPCYNFPRREAIRMAMSYSYDLQATVLDAWDAAEAKLAAQAPVLFGTPTTYLDALKQLVASVEVNEKQVAQIALPSKEERRDSTTGTYWLLKFKEPIFAASRIGLAPKFLGTNKQTYQPHRKPPAAL